VDGPTCGAQEQLCARGTCTQASGLALGTTHSCVQVAGGKGYCWGKIPKDDLTTHNTLAPMELNDLGDLQQIAAGRFHTCMVNAGKVVCLGSNGVGELGQDGEEIPVFALPPVARVVVGYGFSCAATEGGATYCWGARPGAPVSSSSATPVLVEGVDASGGLVAGTQHVCALGAGGEVRCWGTNTSGQVGPQVGGQIEADPPVVPGLGKVLEIYAGPGGTCARSDAGLRCWGVVGPLGYLPEPTLLGLSPEVKRIAIGSKSLCIIDTQMGEVHCSNPEPAAGPILAMSKLDLGGKAREIAAGEGHACAALDDGRVVCWGANDSGQLGVGKLSPQEPPSLPAW
jgi:alpha-tubulin suppressor-like RCC1 family protein